MRLADKLAVPLILIAGGMAYLAEEFAMPFLVPAAIAVLGLFALLLGAETILQGRIQLFDRFYSRREAYAGLSARLLGLIIFLFGAGLIVYTAWDFIQPGRAGEFLAGLVGTSRGRGSLFILFGFFTLLFGVVRLISGSAHSPEKASAWVDLGFRLRGLIGILIAIVLIAIGAWLMFLT